MIMIKLSRKKYDKFMSLDCMNDIATRFYQNTKLQTGVKSQIPPLALPLTSVPNSILFGMKWCVALSVSYPYVPSIRRSIDPG